MIECLGSSPEAFFSDHKQERIVFTQDDMFEKVDEETLKGSILWLVPSAQKNQMEPMLVRLGPGGRTAEIPAHEGEEFAYVLSGRIQLVLGQGEIPPQAGGEFLLHPRAPHYVENPGNKEAQFLWTSTPPSFKSPHYSIWRSPMEEQRQLIKLENVSKQYDGWRCRM